MSAHTGVRERVEALQRYIAEGRIIEALHEFYAEDAVMQENTSPPCAGLAANLEREEEFLASVKEWRDFTVVAIAAEGDTTFVESTMDFVTTDGTEVHSEQVARARWRDGKIVHERFYHQGYGE